MKENVRFWLSYRKLTDRFGVSVTQLSRATGIKISAISNWRSGRTFPRPTSWSTLAGVLGYTAAEVLAMTDDDGMFTFREPAETRPALFQDPVRKYVINHAAVEATPEVTTSPVPEETPAPDAGTAPETPSDSTPGSSDLDESATAVPVEETPPEPVATPAAVAGMTPAPIAIPDIESALEELKQAAMAVVSKQLADLKATGIHSVEDVKKVVELKECWRRLNSEP